MKKYLLIAGGAAATLAVIWFFVWNAGEAK